MTALGRLATVTLKKSNLLTWQKSLEFLFCEARG